MLSGKFCKGMGKIMSLDLVGEIESSRFKKKEFILFKLYCRICIPSSISYEVTKRAISSA